MRRDNLEDESASFEENPRETVVVGGLGSSGEDFRGVAGVERLEMEAMDGIGKEVGVKKRFDLNEI